MEKNGKKRFEKSITDLKSFIEEGRKYWWIAVIALLVSIGVYLYEINAQVDKYKYKVDSIIYVEMDYTNRVLPPSDNVLVWINSDVVRGQVDQMLSVEEKKIESKQIDNSDFFEITVCGKETEETEQVLEDLLEIIVQQVGEIEGINGCRIVSEGKAVKIDASEYWGDAIYIPAFCLLIGIGIIILISIFDKTIYSDYDLKLYFGIMYLGKIKKSDLRNEIVSERLINRFKFSKNNLLVANIENEMLQNEWAKNSMNVCGINMISFEQLGSITEDSGNNLKALLIVYKGISTSEDINCFLEDIQAYGIALFGCIMVE